MKKAITILFFLTVLIGCEKPIDPESIGFQDLLVVEGLITDQDEYQVIKLSRTYPVDDVGPTAVSDAIVEVIVDDSEIYGFVETTPGIYRSATPFAATDNKEYQLHIMEGSTGKIYTSDKVTLTPTPPVDSVYAYFTLIPGNPRGQGFFSFYFDVNNNDTKTRSFRWLWTETYKIKVPNPSRWEWLGGDMFVFRDETSYETQQEFCFRADSSKTLLLGNSDLNSGQLIQKKFHEFHSETRKLNLRYSIELTLYGMSPQASNYWQSVARNSQDQGTFFDEQPGTVIGNITSSTSGEIVLGIFEVVEKKSKRGFFIPSEFYSQGYFLDNNNWITCSSEPILIPFEDAGDYMQENFETQELLFYLTGFGAMFGSKRCALCTLYGSNEEPEFWEE